jgi:hypothetical protein
MSKRDTILNMMNEDSNSTVDSKSSSTLEFNMTDERDKSDDDASSISACGNGTNTSSNCSTSCDSSSSYDDTLQTKRKIVFSKINENWQYFEILNDKEAKCNLCNKIIKTSGNTSNMNYHMAKKHLSGMFM